MRKGTRDVQGGREGSRVARIDDQRDTSAEEPRLLARGADTTWSAAHKVEVRLQAEEGLVRQSHEAKVKTRGPRLPATRRS